MLKRETIKQAIDAIAARDPEIGYSLAELFDTGRIDAPNTATSDQSHALFHFLFDHQRVPVEKNNYFNEGLAAIEQPLIIKYGEIAKKLAMASEDAKIDYAQAHQAIRNAGLSLLVTHETRFAIDRLKAQSGRTMESGPRSEVLELLQSLHDGAAVEGLPGSAEDPRVLFCGAVNADDSALFLRFPYTRDALMQVADLQLPFFSVRFVLRCLRNGSAPQLFACLVNGVIAGMLFLRFKTAFLYKGLEIKYIASARNGPDVPTHRGVGTFLVAGAWLLWKNDFPDVNEMILESEIEASTFYESVGFEKRRSYIYTLPRPSGYLMYALAVMVDRSPSLHPTVIREMEGLIKRQIRLLLRAKPGDPRRDPALHFLKLCLLSRSRPDLARSAAQYLLKNKGRIPEAGHLLEVGTAYGRITIVDARPPALRPLLIFKDTALQSHLQGIFHLENANRVKALESVLEEAPLDGRWVTVPAIKAGKEELGWVHTPRHIERIAATAGKGLHAIDLDTQTTQTSYDAACLAVGGVFALLDGVMHGPSRRGFAVVRPPGHHAEPDRAMGFCLFNNTALGACYLKHAHGARKVMIIDIDAHHGNGTQAAFMERNDVLFVSMHQFPCYPGTGNFGEVGCGRGEGYSVNVPLDKGMGNQAFAMVIHRLAAPLAEAFEPDAILVSCGFDLYRHDRLAGLNGTPTGYAVLTRLLCRIADTVCGGRIAFVMEGGYSAKGIRACGQSVIRELCDLSVFAPERLEKMISPGTPCFPALQKAMAIHSKYWPILRGPYPLPR